jgi:hypothetical protein
MQIPLVEIALTQGFVALVDIEDLPLVSKYKWHAQKGGSTYYAITRLPRRCGKQPALLMHRLLCVASCQVDHKNGNGLDNRRCNLRAAQRSQNLANQLRRKDSSSGYKGVSLHCGRWRARISVNNVRKSVGHFGSPSEAAAAYDSAARTHFGAFAALNFPESGERAA